MAFGRGLLFGFFVGVIATAARRRSVGSGSAPGAAPPGAPSPLRAAAAAARQAAHDEQERLQREFRAARRRGDLYSEGGDD